MDFTTENAKYNDDELVRIVNPKQVLFYLENGLHPLRLEVGYNEKIVFIYSKKPSLKLFHLWCDRDKTNENSY